MMRNYILIVLLISIKSYSFHLFDHWTMNMGVGVINAKQSSENSIQIMTRLGMTKSFGKKLEIGVWGSTLFHGKTSNIANIEKKIIDLNTIECTGVGFNFGYSIYRKGLFSIKPSLDLGYNFIVMRALDFNQDKSAFIDYRMIYLLPKVEGNWTFKKVSIGSYIGYFKEMGYTKGRHLDCLELDGLNAGVQFNIQLE